MVTKSSTKWPLMLACSLLVVSAARAAVEVVDSSYSNGVISWEYPTNDVLQYQIEWTTDPSSSNWHDLGYGLAPTGEAMNVSAPQFFRVGIRPIPTNMVLIRAGTNSGTDPDFGAYSITTECFCVDQYEVSKALWQSVYSWATANGYGFDNSGSGKATNHPVQDVNWYDCVKWCNARSQQEGREPAYYTDSGFTQVYKSGQVAEPYVKSSANGYRLPTTEQWQYAARGGEASRRFPWGATIQHARANYRSDEYTYSYDTSPTYKYHPAYTNGGVPYTSPVGSFAPNGYELYDMVGNVQEWCYDWHTNYVGTGRLIHGGSWYTYADTCRIAHESTEFIWNDTGYTGFRTVLPVD